MNLKKWKVLLAAATVMVLGSAVTACGGNDNKDNGSSKTSEADASSDSGDAAGSDTAAGSSTEGITDTVLNVAIQPAASYAPLYVVKNNGWLEEALEEYGVTVNWTEFESGPPENEAFAAGQQDIGVMGDVPAISAKAAGQDTTIFGIAAYGPEAFAFLVPEDSDIEEVTELKGKDIGIVIGSYAHHLLDAVLEENGLTEADVNLVNLGVGDMQNALLTGEVDAAVIWEPNITRLIEDGIAKRLVDGTGILRGELVIFGREEYLQANPLIAQIFLEQYARASQELDDNTEAAAELIADNFSIDAKLLETVLTRYIYSTVITQDDVDELKDTVEFLKNIDVIEDDVDIDAFVDDQYAEVADL